MAVKPQTSPSTDTEDSSGLSSSIDSVCPSDRGTDVFQWILLYSWVHGNYFLLGLSNICFNIHITSCPKLTLILFFNLILFYSRQSSWGENGNKFWVLEHMTVPCTCSLLISTCFSSRIHLGLVWFCFVLVFFFSPALIYVKLFKRYLLVFESI